MQMTDPANRSRIAVLVVAYNRLDCLKRLTSTLLAAGYDGDEVPLVFCVDASGMTELYDYVNSFDWPHGPKYVIIQQERQGLRRHIFKCFDLTEHFRAAILLEDDLYLSPEYYRYVRAALDKYENAPEVAGIAMYKNETNDFVRLPFDNLHNGSDVMAIQSTCSSGECLNFRMWTEFRRFIDEFDGNFEELEMPERIKRWREAWTKFFEAYLVKKDRYFIYPYTSVSTNSGAAGTHSREENPAIQVNLLYGRRDFQMKDFSELVRYDVFFNNTAIYDALKLSPRDLCIDLWGNNPNAGNRRYRLAARPLPFKVVRGFGLRLRPMELNVLENVPGDDIFLYDTSEKRDVRCSKEVPMAMVVYYLRGFDFRCLLRYLIRTFLLRVRNKLRSYFKG